MSNIGRNSLCICGSGKKYKHCCLDKKDEKNNYTPFQNSQFINSSQQNLAHPAFNAAYIKNEQINAFLFPLINAAEFPEVIASKFSKLQLEESIKKFSDQSNLKISLIRNNNNVLFLVSNKRDECVISVMENGNFGFTELSKKSALPIDAAIYLLYLIVKFKTSPLPIKALEDQWGTCHTVLRSFLNYPKEKMPIVLKGIIIKNDNLNEVEFKKFQNITPESFTKLELRKMPAPFEKITDKMRLSRDISIIPACNFKQEFLELIDLSQARSGWETEYITRKLTLIDWESLYFLFSDGVCFNLKDYFYHPYSLFIPFDLVKEHNSTPFFNIRHTTIWDQEHQDHWSRSNPVQKIILSICNNFFNSSDFINNRMQLYFTNKAIKNEKTIDAIKVSKTYLLGSGNSVAWELTGNEIIGSLNKALAWEDSKTMVVNGKNEKNGFFTLQNNEVILIKNNFTYFQEKVQKIHDELEILQADSGVFKARFKNGAIVDRSLVELKELLNVENLPLLKESSPTIISTDKINLQIFANLLEENIYSFSFNFEVELPSQNGTIVHYELSSTPHLLYRILQGMFQGMGGYYLHTDQSSLVIQKAGETRKNDLKLLRHSGAFKIILSEIFKYLETPYNERAKVKDFQNEIISKVNLIVCGSSSSSFFSSKGERAIKELVKELSDKNLSEILSLSHDSQIFSIDLIPAILQLSSGVLNWIVSSLGESLLEKLQMKELILEQLPYASPEKTLKEKTHSIDNQICLFNSSKMFEGMLTTFYNKSVNTFIDGKRLESLSESELTALIQIDDKNEGIDWFSLHPKIFLRGKELNFEQLQDLKERNVIIHEGIPYHVNYKSIPKLSYLDRFWAKLLNKKNKKTQESANSFVHKNLSLILEILSLRQAGIAIDGNQEWEKVCANFDDITSGKKNEIEKLIKTDLNLPLKDYQKVGTEWMLKLHQIGLGGILADDMGLGKTIQTIGFLEALRLQGNSHFKLIVVPTSLTYNWISEIQKFAPLLQIESFESKNKSVYEEKWKNKPPQIILITYGVMAENEEFLIKFNWQTIIFDEAQNLKNIKSQRTSVARKLKAKSIFCLTGTPMENHFGEFYSLMDLCVPGAIDNYDEFMKTFNLKNVSNSVNIKMEIEHLKQKIAPLVLRRLKKDVLLELPEKRESVILIPFEKKQKEIYRNVAIAWNDKVMSLLDESKSKNTQLEMLTALLRLRQICSTPNAIKNIKYDIVPPKLELLFSTIEELYERGESVLIFTNFVHTLLEIEKYFKKNNFSTQVIHGKLNAKERQRELSSFNETEGASILMMTLKTGGVGLNLTKANFIFHVEPWWNPAAENQATDRSHRMGQSKNVQVYRYIMKDSVEEKIQKLKEIKGKAFDTLFGDINNEESEKDFPKVFNGRLETSDFQYLLS